MQNSISHICLRLSACRWVGFSQKASDDRQVTVWRDTCLSFTPLPAQSTSGREFIEIQGNGTSEWHGERISFELNGSLEWPSRALDVVKTHTGRFTKTVRYRGVLRALSVTLFSALPSDAFGLPPPSLSCLVLGIRGTYDKGHVFLGATEGMSVSVPYLQPKPIEVTAERLETLAVLLTGVWEGEFRGERWIDVALQFNMCEGCLMLDGESVIRRVSGSNKIELTGSITRATEDNKMRVCNIALLFHYRHQSKDRQIGSDAT